MTGVSELRLHCTAQAAAAKSLRHALAAFLAVLDVDTDLTEDALTAVGEALVNVVEHAYEDDPGELELFARIEDDGILSVDVYDRGTFIERDGRRPGRGFGLRIIRAIARAVSLDTEGGTHVHMLFDAGVRPEGAAAL
ncbi:MAG: ATP-binding protein [Candidatus Eremiobacteraeota bacterium]|nr:ATP-binding protein [Candidatus Eremiobacteraeota bacterium]